MTTSARRFRSLDRITIFGMDALEVNTPLSRLLGLALLDPEPGLPSLLFRHCRSVHTFGMRFPLDICLLDRAGLVIAWHLAVGPGRLVGARGARSVLEVPTGVSGTGGRGRVRDRSRGGRDRSWSD